MNPIFSAPISLFLLGTIPSLVRLTAANPVEIGLSRIVLASVSFLIFVKLTGRRISLTRKNAWQCVLIGLCFGTHWLLYFQSIKVAGVVIAALGLATYGVFMLLMGHLVFKEKVGPRDFLALAFTLLGCALLLPQFQWQSQSFKGLVLGLANAFFFSVTMILQKKFSSTITIETRTLSQYVFALPVFLLLWPKAQWQLSARDGLVLLVLGLGCTAVAHSLWIFTIEKISAKTSGIIYYLSTFFALIIGAIGLGELPSLRQIVGGCLIVLSSILATVPKTFWLLAKTKEA